MGKESILSEVLSASIGGAFSASALYPLEVLKTKMQAESKATSSSTKDDDVKGDDDSDGKESTGVSVSDDEDIVMATAEEVDTTSSTTDTTNKPSSTKSIKSNKTNKQQQEEQPKSSDSALVYAQNLYNEEGITPFYQGISTSAFQSATEKALYFFAYTGLKNIHYTFTTYLNNNNNSNNNHHAQPQEMGTIMNLLLGSIAEWAHLPITLPLDCWTTKIQTDKSCANKTPMVILLQMLSDKDGIKGMYKGWQAYTVLCLKPAIQYTVFEQVKKIMLLRKRLSSSTSSSSSSDGSSRSNAAQEESLTAGEAFILGMIARTIATMVVFPYLRAKVMLQGSKSTTTTTTTTSSSSVAPPPTNIPSMIAQMYNNGGLGEVFQGIGPELTRGVLSTALMMMVKEKLSLVVRKALRE